VPHILRLLRDETNRAADKNIRTKLKFNLKPKQNHPSPFLSMNLLTNFILGYVIEKVVTFELRASTFSHSK
jgi:hypothetical protein